MDKGDMHGLIKNKHIVFKTTTTKPKPSNIKKKKTKQTGKHTK